MWKVPERTIRLSQLCAREREVRGVSAHKNIGYSTASYQVIARDLILEIERSDTPWYTLSH